MSEAAFEYGLEFVQNIIFLLSFAVAIHFIKQDQRGKAILTLLIASFLLPLSIELTELYKNSIYEPSLRNLLFNMIAFSVLSIFLLLFLHRYNPSYIQLAVAAFAVAMLLSLFQSNDPLHMKILHGIGIGIGGFFAAAAIKWQFNSDAPPLRVIQVWLLTCILFSLPIYLVDYSGLILER